MNAIVEIFVHLLFLAILYWSAERNGFDCLCRPVPRIAQVMTNLLENALKYSPDAEQVIVRIYQDGDKAVVSVIDFGLGVPEEDRDIVFERFVKGSDSKKDTYPGFGIGLFIAAHIVHRHGGDIWMEGMTGRVRYLVSPFRQWTGNKLFTEYDYSNRVYNLANQINV